MEQIDSLTTIIGFQQRFGAQQFCVEPLQNKTQKISMDAIKLLIIDEHPAVRQALVIRLRSSGHLAIVAVDNNLREGLQHAQQLAPDIILLGLKSTRKEPSYLLADVVHQLAFSGAGVIVLTSYVDVVERELLLQAGARRYLLKNINSERLIAELEAVANEIRPNQPHR